MGFCYLWHVTQRNPEEAGPWVHLHVVCLEPQSILRSSEPGTVRLSGAAGSPVPSPVAASAVAQCLFNAWAQAQVVVNRLTFMDPPCLGHPCCPGSQQCQVEPPARTCSSTETSSSPDPNKTPLLAGPMGVKKEKSGKGSQLFLSPSLSLHLKSFTFLAGIRHCP